jgi:hypothetical protein
MSDTTPTPDEIERARAAGVRVFPMFISNKLPVEQVIRVSELSLYRDRLLTELADAVVDTGCENECDAAHVDLLRSKVGGDSG